MIEVNGGLYKAKLRNRFIGLISAASSVAIDTHLKEDSEAIENQITAYRNALEIVDEVYDECVVYETVHWNEGETSE